MSSIANVLAARDALWAMIAKNASSIKRDFVSGATGNKAVDAMDKEERVKAFDLVERSLNSKLKMAGRALPLQKSTKVVSKATVKTATKKQAIKSERTAKAIAGSKSSAAADKLNKALQE